ncbi:NAD(P)H-dependent oxidoreductase [Massilia sp. CF038]|uniref:NAD(P)H-dependent oxidoreductase n=1 Tax=Massilia sp. CF038 TaxID=1881045 RepID=UPI0009246B05|nr:NAD(P)H-dependent oxidoreductase [Massilia sp. CF038]SHG54554.1 Putative NADPH-quinone reductase (modulator of drug activity B) [Massilia sp. CF038]
MAKRILLIQGHPDLCQDHLCHTLADAYANGAAAAGHELRRTTVAELDFPLLRSQHEWEKGALPQGLLTAQNDIVWAQHMVIFFPLWLGDMPALFKGFLEQVARPGFAFAGDKPLNKKPLAGRSARVVVTMGMPALLYRLYFRAHSIKSLKRNVLLFVGIKPVRHTLIGMVGNARPDKVSDWALKLQDLGRRCG